MKSQIYEIKLLKKKQKLRLIVEKYSRCFFLDCY